MWKNFNSQIDFFGTTMKTVCGNKTADSKEERPWSTEVPQCWPQGGRERERMGERKVHLSVRGKLYVKEAQECEEAFGPNFIFQKMTVFCTHLGNLFVPSS